MTLEIMETIRRLEDKLSSQQMEMKVVQVTFSLEQLHGNRTFNLSKFGGLKLQLITV